MNYSMAFLVALLLSAVSYGNATAQYRVIENLRHERVLLPSSAPDRSLMVVTDHTMVWDHEVALFVMVTYDDPRTKREIDYMEVYDLGGNLVLITWTDRFGVYQVAMDQVLLTDESDVLDRRLVVVTAGTPT